MYTALAPIYDRIMAHVDYGEWVGLITDVLARYSAAEQPSILEFGAGTAVLGQRLRQRGLRYFGSDVSFAMCKQAAGRACVPFCADARHPPVREQFDLVLFLYDGINYFMGLDEYRAFFHAAYHCLHDTGLLLFDVTTTANSLNHFSDFIDYDEIGPTMYVRTSTYNPENRTQHNNFTIFSRDPDHPGLYRRNDEHHIQRVFAIAEIGDAIPGDLFDVLGKWDGFTFRKYSPRSERVHFLLRKRRGS